MSSIRKRGNHPFRQRSLRDVILSSFCEVPRTGICRSENAAVASVPRRDRVWRGPGAFLPVNLACISTEEGARGIAMVKNALRRFLLDSQEVASSLAEDDDGAPPLCCMVELLEDGLLRTADLHFSAMARRLKIAVEKSDGICNCEELNSNVLRRTVDALICEGFSMASKRFLQQLVKPLVIGAHDLVQFRVDDGALSLAAKTVEVLKTIEHEINDCQCLLVEWTVLSVCSEKGKKINSDEINGSMWSRDLAGIACGKDARHYLLLGEAEEASLNVLYGAAGPEQICTLLVSILTSALLPEAASRRALNVGSFQSVNWPRMFTLISRVCDPQKWSDLKGTERASIELFLFTAIAADPLPDTHRVCAVIALSRYVCRCGRNASSVDDRERGFRDHGRWLNRLIESAHERVLKPFCSGLHAILSCDDPRYLSTCVKALSRVKPAHYFVQSYVEAARRRLADFNMEMEGDFVVNRDALIMNNTFRSKAVRDVEKYVTEFAKARDLIPASLVRQMNFHRYHFRTTTLEVLLSSDFAPSDSFVRREFPRGGIREFNEQRLQLIRRMAFERKDSVITRMEAVAAIKAINDNIDPDRSRSDGVSKDIYSSLTCDSPVYTLVDALSRLRSEPALSSGSSSDFDLQSRSICAMLSQKIIKVSKETTSGLYDVAADFIQSVLRAIARHQITRYCEGVVEDTDTSSEQSLCSVQRGRSVSSELDPAAMENCREWLHTDFSWVHTVLVEVLKDCRMARFRKLLQTRLLTLAVLQIDQLEVTHVVALAVFLYMLTNCCESASLEDMAFILRERSGTEMQHIMHVIVDELPLKSPLHILRSAQFCTCFTFLFRNNPAEQNRKHEHMTELDVDESVPNEEEMKTIDSRSYNSDIIPCSQSTTDEALDNDDSIWHNSKIHNHFISSMVRLMRWVLASPWRILGRTTAPAYSCTEFKRAQSKSASREVYLNETNVEVEWLSVLRMALSLLHYSRFAMIKLSPGDWIMLESRAGWGCVEEATSILHSYNEMTLCPCNLLCSIAPHLAKVCTGFGEWGDCCIETGPLWIFIALQKLANEVTARHQVPYFMTSQETSRELGTSNFKADQHFYLFEAVEKFCLGGQRSDVSVCAVLRFASQLPSELYFGNASRTIVTSHISNALVPHLWPLSFDAAKAIIVVYLHWQERNESELDNCHPPLSCTVLMALHWRSMQKLFTVQTSLASGRPRMVLNRAKAISRMLSKADLVEGPDNENASLTIWQRQHELGACNLARHEDTSSFEILEEDSIAIAVCLVNSARIAGCSMGLKYFRKWKQKLSCFLDEFRLRNDFAITELLDVAIDVSAFSPLLGSSDLKVDEACARTECSLRVVAQFVEVHLSLHHVAVPEFLNGYSKGLLPPGAAIARKELGILPYLRGTADTRNDNTSGIYPCSPSDHLDVERFLNVFVSGQVAAAFGEISDDALQRAESIFRVRDGNHLALVLIEKYVRCARMLRSETAKTTIGSISYSMLSKVETFAEKAICRTLSRSPTVRREAHAISELAVLNPSLWSRVTCT